MILEAIKTSLILLLPVLITCTSTDTEIGYYNPVFTSDCQYAVIKTESTITRGPWGDPYGYQSTSQILINNIETDESNIIFDKSNDSYNPISHINFDNSDSLISMFISSLDGNNDSIITINLKGNIVHRCLAPSFLTEFYGWLTKYSEIPYAISESSELAIYNINNKSERIVGKAAWWEGMYIYNKKVISTVRNEVYLYENDISSKLLFKASLFSWINDTLLSFRLDAGPFIAYNFNTSRCDTLSKNLEKFKSFSISPNMNWVIYTKWLNSTGESLHSFKTK